MTDANQEQLETLETGDEVEFSGTFWSDGFKTEDTSSRWKLYNGVIETINGESVEEAKETKKEEKKESAEQLDYKQLEKNPDRHTGKYVIYSGQIVEIQESDNTTYMRLAVTKTDYGYNQEDIIYVEYDGYTEFVEEDEVTIYGDVYGTFDYTSQAGWEISIPAVIADIVE